MQTGAFEHVEHLCTLARARIAAGNYDGARTYLVAARTEAGASPPPELLRLLADLTAQLHDFAAGIQLMEQALDAFRLAEDWTSEVITAADLAALLQRRGNLGRARALIEWALAHVNTDDQAQRSRLLNIAATVSTFQGRLEDALALLAEAQPLASGRVASWIALNTVVALSNLRRHADARQSLAQAAAVLPPDDAYTPLMLAYARTWCAIMEDDYTVAHTLCQDALQRMAPRQHPIVYHPTVATLGVLAREAGDLPRAETLLAQAIDVLQARNDQAAVIGIHWQQALLAQTRGDDQAAEAELRTALNVMQAGGYGITLLWQPQRFVALCRWGIERGVEVTYATWLLQTSLASWTTPSYPGVPVRDERSAAPRSVERASAVLTAREREVLMLAAQGLRDEEIAIRLCLSIRTVRNHLQHCYDKLGVHSRVAAVRLILDERAFEA